jgi:hypothetical protein
MPSASIRPVHTPATSSTQNALWTGKAQESAAQIVPNQGCCAHGTPCLSDEERHRLMPENEILNFAQLTYL